MTSLTQSITQKTKDRVTWTPLKTGGELRCSGKVSSSCSTSGTRVHPLFKWGSCHSIFSFLCSACMSVIVLYVHLRFTSSDYPLVSSNYSCIKIFWKEELYFQSNVNVFMHNKYLIQFRESSTFSKLSCSFLC
jgi:hypothetical protein